MDFVGSSMIILLSSLLGAYLLFSFVQFLHKVCWNPIQIQSLMRSQGIEGPSYRFFYGNTKELLKMREDSLGKPMESLSHHILPKIQPQFYSWINKYGRSFLFWNGPKAHFVTMETEYVKEILSNKEKSYSKGELNGYMKKILGDGLVTAEGEKWTKLRKLANHTFHSDSLKNMAPAMISSVEMMLERWKQHEGKEIEVYEEFRFLTSEVISRTAFGSSYIEGKDIFEKLSKLTHMAARNSFKIRLPGLSKFFKTRDEIESEELEQDVKESIIGIIKKRENKETGQDCIANDYLGLLLKAASYGSDESYKLTIDDVVDDCKTFYFAGQETTTSLLAWTFLLLGVHTDWQEKAREEVLDLFGQHQPNSDGISRMNTMNMIINESLRLYSPVVTLRRRVKKEVKLGKVNLRPNTALMIPNLALHHDTQIWGGDALLFKPERFSEGVAKATKNNPAAFLPFGLGPRTCVGYNFATNEAKIALSMVLQRYAFTLSPTYIHSPILVLTLRPQHGVQVLLHPL